MTDNAHFTKYHNHLWTPKSSNNNSYNLLHVCFVATTPEAPTSSITTPHGRAREHYYPILHMRRAGSHVLSNLPGSRSLHTCQPDLNQLLSLKASMLSPGVVCVRLQRPEAVRELRFRSNGVHRPVHPEALRRIIKLWGLHTDTLTHPAPSSFSFPETLGSPSQVPRL